MSDTIQNEPSDGVDGVVDFATRMFTMERSWWDSQSTAPETRFRYYQFLATHPGFSVLPRLACEAIGPDHPAHALFKERLDWQVNVLEAAFAQGPQIDFEDFDPIVPAVTITSIWDGFSFLWLHLQRPADTPALVTALQASLRGIEGVPDIDFKPLIPPAPPADCSGSALTLLERYLAVVSDQEPTIPSDLADLGTLLGLPETQLQDDFTSADEFGLALHRRFGELTQMLPADEASPHEVVSPHSCIERQIDWLDEMTFAHPSLLRWWTWLMGQSVHPDHVAHRWMSHVCARVLDTNINLFTAMHRTGQLRDAASPVSQSIAYTALVFGLRIRWAYSPETIDMSEHLRTHLSWVFPRS